MLITFHIIFNKNHSEPNSENKNQVTATWNMTLCGIHGEGRRSSNSLGPPVFMRESTELNATRLCKL